jgi:pentatricopeptide repeat protein
LLHQAIELEPFVEKGHSLLAEAYFKSGDLRKACELWEVAKTKNEVTGNPMLFTCK